MRSLKRESMTGTLVLAAVLWSCVAAGDGKVAPSFRTIPKLSEVGPVLEVMVGRSRLLRLPEHTERVGVSDPSIADVEMITPDEVMVVGVSTGAVDLHVWKEDGSVWSTELRVQLDLERFNEDLRNLLSGTDVAAVRSGDTYYIHGSLRHADQARALEEFLEVREVKSVNQTRLDGVQQVQIKVRVAEVNRGAIRKMTVNAFKVSDSWFVGSSIGSATGAFIPMNIGAPGGILAQEDIPFALLSNIGPNPLVTLLAGFPGSDLELFLEALEEQQYVRILAEPTLVALSGEEASFLAGGEYPIPVAQESAGTGVKITIEYKEFGVRLRMKPTVLGENRIRLNVAPEVSELSSVGAVEIQGFSIPSLMTRRSETTLELRSGETFAMAGLLMSSSNARKTQLPLLGDLPVLGPMFRSVDYTSGESELMVLVTADLVEPMAQTGALPMPGDLHETPDGWELLVDGQLHGAARPGEDPGGIMFQDLQGPGGWARY